MDAPIPIPQHLVEMHEHISETFSSVDSLLTQFAALSVTTESTATHIVATHEPLYKAKRLLVQLIGDIAADDTQTTLAADPTNPHTLLISHAFLYACTLCSGILLKAAETAEAYRWCCEALRLIEVMQNEARCGLNKQEFKSIDAAKLAKYSPAQSPKFFLDEKGSSASSPKGAVAACMGLELLLLACQVWAVWSEPDNVRVLAEAAERLTKRIPASTAATALRPPTGAGDSAADTASSPVSSPALQQSAPTALSLETIIAAQAGDTVARIDVAKAQLSEVDAARALLDDRERSRQEAVTKMKLLQRRAAKAGEKISVFAVPEWMQHFLQPTTKIESVLPANVGAAEAAKRRGAADFIVATCPALWAKGEIESRAFADARHLDSISCVVQAYKGNSNQPVSAFYSHRVLTFRLPEVVSKAAQAAAAKKARATAAAAAAAGSAAAANSAATKDEEQDETEKQQQLDEWTGLCLSLSEFYLEERDLSHTAHCLDVCEALMQHRGAIADATSSISTYKGYKTSNGVMLRLLRLRLAALILRLCFDSLEQQAQLDGQSSSSAPPSPPAAAATSSQDAAEQQEPDAASFSLFNFKDTTSATVQLFQNPLLLPEEFASLNSNKSSNPPASGVVITDTASGMHLPPNWKSRFVDTTARMNLLDKVDDANLDALVPRPTVFISVTGRTLRQLAQARLQDYNETLIPQLMASLNVAEDCERYIQSRRAVAEFYGITFRITRNPVVGERRLKVLNDLRNVELHEQVFRNVLRQAEFDFATQSICLADLVPKDARRSYYEQAEGALSKFCAAFDREINLAKKENLPIPLEGSDFVAFALGSMRRLETLLKLGKIEDAGKASATLVEFATKYASEGGEQLAEIRTLAVELSGILNGGNRQLLTQAVQKVEIATKNKKVLTSSASASTRHVDPKAPAKKK